MKQIILTVFLLFVVSCCLANDLQNSTSQCQFGTLPSHNTCNPLYCQIADKCQLYFGPTTTCDTKSNQCICDDLHLLDPVTQTCSLENKSYFPVCSSDLNCRVHNSQCIQGKCECKFPYTRSLEKYCIQLYCKTDEQCRTKFGDNTFCLYDKCLCAGSYHYNTNMHKCVTDKRDLNSICSKNSECGENAVCANSRCKCLVGTVPRPQSSSDCEKLVCESNLDCTNKFNHTKCDLIKGCSCDSDAGYKQNDAGDSCFQTIGGTCRTEADCGAGTMCLQGQCKCGFGSEVKSKQMDCHKVNCFTNADCTPTRNSVITVIDDKVQCSAHTCVCKDGYKIDPLSQTCVANINYIAIVGVAAFVTIALVIAGMAFISYRGSSQTTKSLPK